MIRKSLPRQKSDAKKVSFAAKTSFVAKSSFYVSLYGPFCPRLYFNHDVSNKPNVIYFPQDQVTQKRMSSWSSRDPVRLARTTD